MRAIRLPAVSSWLITLAAARAALVFIPGTWAWSLQLQRFVPPGFGWALWGMAALSLWPPVARAQEPLFARLASALDRTFGRTAVLLAAIVAITAFALPDRTWFTGDFLLRMGAVESGRDFAIVAPQSLPLDLWLHVALPRAAAAAGWIASAADAARWLGALEAGGLILLAAWAAAEYGWRGRARLAFIATVAGGSALALMTGYGKTSGDMCLFAIAVAVLARRFAREGRGAVPLGLVLAAALATHRSALILVPAWAVAWGVLARGGAMPRSVVARAIGIGLPVLAIALLAPRLTTLLLGFDLPRHVFGAGGGTGMLRSFFDPVHLLDRFNIALAYAPLAPLALLPIAGMGNGESARPPDAADLRGRWTGWALAWPAFALLLLVRPQQGLFRDWDVFAIPGMVLALASARRVAAWVEGDAAGGGRLAPILWSAVVGAGLWLVAGHDDARGLARVRAFATESPARAAEERGKLWEFLGDRSASLGRWDDAAEALRQAVRDQPSPRLYLMLSMAEEAGGRLEAAEAAVRAAAERDPADASAFAAWARLAMRRGDAGGAREAARGLSRLVPRHPLVAQILGDSAAARR